MIRRDIWLTKDDLPAGWSPELADLINSLLEKNQSERLGHRGIQEIKQHSYFAGFKWHKFAKKELKPPFIPNVISEMKEYLDEIAMFNHLNGQNDQENIPEID